MQRLNIQQRTTVEYHFRTCGILSTRNFVLFCQFCQFIPYWNCSVLQYKNNSCCIIFLDWHWIHIIWKQVCIPQRSTYIWQITEQVWIHHCSSVHLSCVSFHICNSLIFINTKLSESWCILLMATCKNHTMIRSTSASAVSYTFVAIVVISFMYTYHPDSIKYH